MSADRGRVLALVGGVGGAKLALGLLDALPAGALSLAVNTADDFRHFGLHVSPDVDTQLYTLSGRSDEVRGWGRAGESWQAMGALAELGAPTWFNLGDRDLALHLERTRLLAEGLSLTEVTARFAAAYAIPAEILPMTDDPVRTILDTDEGPMEFQPWFVGRQAGPAVRAVRFQGAEAARPAPRILDLLAAADLRAVILAPSNPFLSLDPILALPGIREALVACPAPVVAVTPVVGGQAIKGPTAKMMRDFGLEPTPAAVAMRCAGFIDGFLADEADLVGGVVPGLEAAPFRVATAPTIMRSRADKAAVARATLALADALA